MKISTCVAVGLVAAWGGLPEPVCPLEARAAETAPALILEEKYLADLARPEPDKVSSAVNYFMQHKTAAAKVVLAVLPLLKVTSNDYNDNSRLSALADLLGHYGPQAKTAIPQLIEIAETAKQDWARERSRIALAKIGPDDGRVFAALSKSLRWTHSPGDVVTSAQALAKMGPIATRAIPDLGQQIRELEKTRAMQFADVSAAYGAYYALGEIALKNRPLPSLAEAIKTLERIDQAAPDKSVLAFLQLQKSGRSAAQAVPLLLSIIGRDEEFSQGAAIDTLGFIGVGADLRATQTLVAVLARRNRFGTDDQTFLSQIAQNALFKATPADAAAVPALVEALKNPQPRVRIVAARALANIGVASLPAAANLSAALRATDEKTDSYDEWPQLTRLAMAIGQDQGGLLDALLQLLDSPRVLGRDQAGSSPTRANLWIAVATIVAQSGAKLENSKRRAIATRVIKTLELACQGERPDDLLLVGAARAAAALGAQGKDAVPILMHTIQSQRWRGMKIAERDGMIFYGYIASTSVPLEVIRALGRIGKSSAPALPLLQTLAEAKPMVDPDGNASPPNSSDAAREAIRQINAAT